MELLIALLQALNTLSPLAVAYYLDRRGRLPLPVVRARVMDDVESRVYIDPRTASVVGKHHPREWFTRWGYRGLHSFDFPWLYTHRPAWDIVVITFMLGGTALALTSLVLAWRAPGRTLAAMLTAPRDHAPISGKAWAAESIER